MVTVQGISSNQSIYLW